MLAWIERQRCLIDFTLAAIARRKARNLGLLAIYALLIFVLASVMLFTQALRQEAAAVLAGAPEVTVQRLVAGRHDLIPAADLARLGQLRGVQAVRGRLWGYYYDPVIKGNYTFLVPEEAPPPGSLVIGPELARARGLVAGSAVSFRSYTGQLATFTIFAVLPQASALASADLVLLGESDFRALFAYPANVFTDLALSVANPQEVRTVAGKVAKALPEARVILREDLLRTYASLFDWREGLVLLVFSGALLAFVILAWDKASGLSSEEQRELGILKAIGWETADLLKLKGWEGGLLSLAAFVLGYGGAYLHVFHGHARLFEPVLQGWAVLYPRFALTPSSSGLSVATLLLFTTVPYTAAVLVPSWRAATRDPDLVMRG